MRRHLNLVFILFLLLTPFMTIAGNGKLTDRAAALLEEGRTAEAADLYARALHKELADGRWRSALVIAQEGTLALQDAKAYAEARDLMALCLARLELWQAGQDSLLAQAYHKHGVSYYYLKDFWPSIQAYQRALRLRECMLAEDDTEIIKTYRNIGLSFHYLGMSDSAAHYMQECLNRQIRGRKKDGKLLAQTYHYLGNIYTRQGDIARAENMMLASAAVLEEDHAGDTLNLVKTYLDVCRYFMYLDLGKRMIDFAQRVLGQIGTAEDEWDYFRADAYNYLGIGHRMLDHLDTATYYLRWSADINRRHGAEREIELANNLHNLAYTTYRQSDYGQAFSYSMQANDLYRQLQEDYHLADGLSASALYLSKMGERERSMQHFQEALTLLAPDFQPTHYREHPRLADMPEPAYSHAAEMLYDKAHVLNRHFGQREDLLAARQALQLSIAYVEDLRQRFDADASKAHISAQAKKYLEEAIFTSFRLWEMTGDKAYFAEAFEYAERSKAYVLLAARSQSATYQDPAIVARQQQLLRRQSDLRRDIYQATQSGESSAIIQQLREQLVEHELMLTAFQDSLRRADPDNYGQFEIATLDQLRKRLLTNDRALVEYVVGEHDLYVFYIGHSDQWATRLPLDFPLKDHILDLRKALSESAYIEMSKHSASVQQQFDQRYVRQATLLYDKLFAPLEERFDLPKRLLIIPDGVLGYLPFDALLTRQPLVLDYRQLPYLGQAYRLSFDYSATFAATEMSARKRQARMRVLGFAPSFPENLNIVNADMRTGLQKLVHNRSEIEEVAELFPVDPYYGAAADRETFLREAPYYSCLHLSSHAILNAANSEYSFICFTQSTDTLNVNQLLYVSDLYNRRMPADLAVLSACETSMGDVAPGEGIISLARAFAHAGVRSTLTTLWSVNDRATRDLVVSFYRGLAEDLPKDEALWQAKNQHLGKATFFHPYFWSAMVVYGDVEPLNLQRTHLGWWLLAGGLVLVVIFGIERLRKQALNQI